MARVAEVARFLGVEARDVRRMVRFDALPAVKVPGPTKPLLRLPLRGLREWLDKRGMNGGMSAGGASFAEFVEEFYQAAAVRSSATSFPIEKADGWNQEFYGEGGEE